MFIKLTSTISGRRIYAAAGRVAYIESSEGRHGLPRERTVVCFGEYEGSLSVREEPHVVLHRIRRALEGHWPALADPRWEEEQDTPPETA
jgi:hypothetical protein